MPDESLRTSWNEAQANRLAASVEAAAPPAEAAVIAAEAAAAESDVRSLSTPPPADIKELAVEAIYAVAAATAEVGEGVVATPRHLAGSLLQSFVERKALEEGLPLESDGCGDKWVKFSTSDFDRWIGEYLVNLFGRLLRGKHPGFFSHPDDAVIADLPAGRVVLVSDWGTGRYGATRLSTDLASLALPIGLCAHLGDIYYSGEPPEISNRFEPFWPQIPGAVSRAINANHEMYSGGYGFFDQVLGAFGQDSSYFAYGNEEWVLVFLDSGYRDHDLHLSSKAPLRNRQLDWLRKIVALAEDRRVILFTHHQLFDPWSGGGHKLLAAIRDLLEERRIYGWYWGHQHHATIFRPHDAYGLRARCIGHGGMPYSRRAELAGLPVAHQAGAYRWHEVKAKNGAPEGLRLDGPNAFVCEREADFGPNGFVMLDFEGPECRESYFVSGLRDPVWEDLL